MIPGLVILASGVLMAWASRRSWRLRDQEAVSLVEAATLKVADEEPLPQTRYDRIALRVHTILGLILGTVFTLVGLVLIANSEGLL